MKKVAILGSTGSIGTQSTDVIGKNRERFEVTAMTCGNNLAVFRKQLAEHAPKLAVCRSQDDARTLSAEFPDIRFSWGEHGLIEAASSDCDIVINALTGMLGLLPTYAAIVSGNDVALANKETLVAGGNVIMRELEKRERILLPIDSEHSAVFQCLEGNGEKRIRRILLTCSGGPFRGLKREALNHITPEKALKHPNWSMGKKISIDSATLMNKGLEMIEAKWMFDIGIDDIEVLVHPQSIMHSGVEFEDSSVIAQLGVPDMRVPIAVALAYPERLKLPELQLDFFDRASNMTFEKPDLDTFRCILLAAAAARLGGTYTTVLNAANEVLVQAFLERKIGFLQIEDGIERMLERHDSVTDPDLETIVEVDKVTRAATARYIIC